MPLVKPISIKFEADARELETKIDTLTEDFDKFAAHNRAASDSADKAAKTATMSWTDFRSMYSTVLDVVRVGQQVWEATYGEFSKLTDEVRDFSLISGQGAEQTSRFLQVLGDFGITAGQATTAARYLKNNGLSPNIDSLAMLADKFKSIKDPAKRFAFLEKQLGMGGKEWVNVLNQESSALRERADAVNKNLIVTEQDIRLREVQRLAMDDVKDEIEGFTISLGRNIALVTAHQIAVNRANDILEENGQQTFWNKASTEEWNAALEQAIREQLGAADASLVLADSLVIQEEDARALAAAVTAMTTANSNYLKTIGSLTTELGNYGDKQDDLKTTHGELLAEKETLISQGWGVESEAVKDVNDKLADNETAQQDNAKEFELAIQRRMLARLEEELSVGGLDEREREYLLQVGLARGIYTEEAITQMQAIETEVGILNDAYSRLPSLVTTTIQTIYQSLQTSAPKYWQSEKHASGGDFMIPMSYGNEGFRMGNGDTASGGELIKITPKGTKDNGNADIIKAIEQNRLDEDRLARVLRDVLLQVNR